LNETSLCNVALAAAAFACLSIVGDATERKKQEAQLGTLRLAQQLESQRDTSSD
jgi:hypothetical protein